MLKLSRATTGKWLEFFDLAFRFSQIQDSLQHSSVVDLRGAGEELLPDFIVLERNWSNNKITG